MRKKKPNKLKEESPMDQVLYSILSQNLES